MRERPSDVMAVMSHCLIMRAEHLGMNDVVEYWAYSELFEKIEEGYSLPEYVFKVKEYMQDGLCFTDVTAERTLCS